jgi:short-subunit dehydrogenase
MAGLREYTNKVAVVTGASGGIGAELARQLARKGMRLALVARRADRLEALAVEIAQAGATASVHPCDVADRTAVETCARAVREAYGRIDLLVNCAGYVTHILFKDHDLDDIERMVRTNCMGTLYWIKAALPLMRTQGAGWILNFSSFAGLVPQPDEAAYTATKFAIAGLSDALAYEFEPLGIHVMCVYPVMVRSEMFTREVMDRMPKDSEKRFMDTDRFVAETLGALERGEHHVVLPRRYRGVAILRTLFPKLLGRKVASVRFQALSDLRS